MERKFNDVDTVNIWLPYGPFDCLKDDVFSRNTAQRDIEATLASLFPNAVFRTVFTEMSKPSVGFFWNQSFRDNVGTEQRYDLGEIARLLAEEIVRGIMARVIKDDLVYGEDSTPADKEAEVAYMEQTNSNDRSGDVELSDSVFLPAAIGVALCASAQQAAQEMRHDGDLRRAQAWIDHLALGAQMAADDFRDALADLAAARREASVLRAALEESDSENLRLSMELGRLRRAVAH